MPPSARDAIGLTVPRRPAESRHAAGLPAQAADTAVAAAVVDEPDDSRPQAQPSDAAGDHHARMRRRLALALAAMTPTLLPELMHSLSRQAGHLASHPLNAVDNNPFITREWLIVSQVLHSAAQTMEKRFEALFLGL